MQLLISIKTKITSEKGKKVKIQKIHLKSQIQRLGFSREDKIIYSDKDKCLKPSTRCTNLRILNIFPKFLWPSPQRKIAKNAKNNENFLKFQTYSNKEERLREII